MWVIKDTQYNTYAKRTPDAFFIWFKKVKQGSQCQEKESAEASLNELRLQYKGVECFVLEEI